MTWPDMRAMNASHLAVLFAEIGIAQAAAIEDSETAVFNRLYDQLAAVQGELKLRPDDQRRILLPLLDHPNLQVRLNAAVATLAVAPDEARRALEAIRKTQWNPQAAEAVGTLRDLDRGSFVPT